MNTRTEKNTPGRVVVGMSGGVDSSVAAWLLKQQGYEVVGLFMKNWEDDDGQDGDPEYCCARQDWLDAVSVADVIGVEIDAVNFAAEYKERVFAEFLREYEAGRTPNPDVLCNAEIKFKAFLDHAVSMGADHIATGHYARVRRVANPAENTDPPGQTGRYQLLKGVDAGKDQSYFLHRLNQSQLARTLFPLGGLPKTEVRRMAHALGLPNAAKKDSTGICFIGERPFRQFLNRYLPSQPGPIKTPDGQTVGQHHGLAFYTLGQRKGLGIGGIKNYQKQGCQKQGCQKQDSDGIFDAWYVARKSLADNTLYVVPGHNHPWLLQDRLHAQQASWVAGCPPAGERGITARYTAKTRYRQPDVDCDFACDLVCEAVSGVQGHARFTLTFDQPQWAITPGQSAVLYDGDVCLGGGIIG